MRIMLLSFVLCRIKRRFLKLFSSVNNMVLGDVQAFYTGFQEHVYNLNNYLVLNYYPQKIDAIKKQIAKYDTYYHNLLRQRQIETEQFAISHGQYRRDSVLYGEGIIALADLEISKTKLKKIKTHLIILTVYSHTTGKLESFIYSINKVISNIDKTFRSSVLYPTEQL